jgi:hypothetical protein
MSEVNDMAMTRDELIERLALAVAADDALLLDGWKHLVLVSQIEAGTPDMTGFCYTGDGRAVPVAPADFAIFDVIGALRDAMADSDRGRPWQAALFRVDRASGKVTAEFEYDDPARWAVTPDNVAARSREFAPA